MLLSLTWSGFLLLLLPGARANPELEFTRTCEPIRIKTCMNIGYNVTGMPNFVGHDIQRDADLQLQTFTPLIQYGCSSRLRFFLCSVYAPMCTEKVPQPIGPCRPLCESVKGLCEPVLLEFGFKWPSPLNCSQFPVANNEKHMCMEGPEIEEQKQPPLRERRPVSRPVQKNSQISRSRPPPGVNLAKYWSRTFCKHLRLSDRYFYLNNSDKCVASCRSDILYSRENKAFAQVWIGVWSVACFLATLCTIIKFFMASEPVQYPEKIIIILSWCYFIFSIAFIVRLVGGRENSACYYDSSYKEPLLVQGGVDNINCTVIFTLLYFFGMAGCIWWGILARYWFLVSGLQQDTEILNRYSPYYHGVAWILPGIMTVYILVMRLVDADELTGICYVGFQDAQAMVRFVLVPSTTFLIIGLIFLLAGIIAIQKNKKYHGNPGYKDEKKELCMVRIGIFCFLYTIPAVCVLLTNYYEYFSRDSWLAADSLARPNVEFFTLKIFMSLVVGITTCVWLCFANSPNFKRVNFNLKKKFCPSHRGVYNARNQQLLLQGLQHKMTIV